MNLESAQYIPGTDDPNEVIYRKLREHFDGRIVRKDLTNGGNVGAAAVIGKLIAERALKAGVDQVAFDRSGFQYHGRIKALAEAAREAGLKF